MKVLLRLSIVVFFALLIVLPIVFGEIMMASLEKLHLSPGAALLAVIGILFGGLVNIPLKRIARDDEVIEGPFLVYGFPDLFPRLVRKRRDTVIAVNVGGCLIPTGLVLYELAYLGAEDWRLLPLTAAACLVTIFVCHQLAQPVPGIGIAMPGFVPPAVAALVALVLAPEAAAPVAFVAGVTGPLIGADLLHLREIARLGAGTLSIGGAGTFDGIVLSGIIAAYIA